MRPSHRNQAGTLLIEAMVSFLIFLLAAMVFYSLLATSRRAESKSRETVAAVALAREVLEGAQGLGYDALPLGEEKGELLLASERDGPTRRSGVTGQTRLVYTRVVRQVPGRMVKSVVTTVTWHNGRVEIEGYVGNI